MDIISELLNYIRTGDYKTLILTLVFITTVFLTVGVFFWLMVAESPTKRRLREIAEGQHRRSSHETHMEGVFSVKWVEQLSKIILPSDDWKQSRIKSKLVHAGHIGPNVVKTFMILKVSLAFALPLFLVLPLMITGILKLEDTTTAIPLLVATALLAYYLPDIVVHMQTKERQRLFIEGFPDAMDMLVVCVEAGLGIDSAINRVADEIGLSHPELAKEFHMVSLELRAGKTREQALRGLGERTGVPQVQALSSLLIQAEHFGTSIARALREHAEEMRNIRMQVAKEKAAKLPVKMIFPLIFFIFPALFLVILGPAVIRIYEGFIVGFGGG